MSELQGALNKKHHGLDATIDDDDDKSPSQNGKKNPQIEKLQRTHSDLRRSSSLRSSWTSDAGEELRFQQDVKDREEAEDWVNYMLRRAESEEISDLLELKDGVKLAKLVEVAEWGRVRVRPVKEGPMGKLMALENINLILKKCEKHGMNIDSLHAVAIRDGNMHHILAMVSMMKNQNEIEEEQREQERLEAAPAIKVEEISTEERVIRRNNWKASTGKIITGQQVSALSKQILAEQTARKAEEKATAAREAAVRAETLGREHEKGKQQWAITSGKVNTGAQVAKAAKSALHNRRALEDEHAAWLAKVEAERQAAKLALEAEEARIDAEEAARAHSAEIGEEVDTERAKSGRNEWGKVSTGAMIMSEATRLRKGKEAREMEEKRKKLIREAHNVQPPQIDPKQDVHIRPTPLPVPVPVSVSVSAPEPKPVVQEPSIIKKPYPGPRPGSQIGWKKPSDGASSCFCCFSTAKDRPDSPDGDFKVRQRKGQAYVDDDASPLSQAQRQKKKRESLDQEVVLQV